MPKRPEKFRLLLDEMFPGREKFPETNSYHDLKSVSLDFKRSGITDTQVLKLAKKEKRIVVTKNKKHYLELASQLSVGLIAVKETMAYEEVDRKIMAFLRRQALNWTGFYELSHSPRK